jgi:hypothetical protein
LIFYHPIKKKKLPINLGIKIIRFIKEAGKLNLVLKDKKRQNEGWRRISMD